jgi:hypothetical protein
MRKGTQKMPWGSGPLNRTVIDLIDLVDVVVHVI